MMPGHCTSNNIRIICLGDIMPGGVLHGADSVNLYTSANLRETLAEADLRIATLECAIGDTPDFDPEKMKRKQDVIYAPNCDAEKLSALGINCVSLANNHAFDLGAEGLSNTIKQLDRLNIKHCGAGRDAKEAARPAEFFIKGKRIAVIAFCDFREETVGYVPIASTTCPGMNSLKDDAYIQQISDLHGLYDYIIVMIHWGTEHTFWPTASMVDVAHKCIAAGASAIIGGHQHRIQPITEVNGKPVMWGLGNFLFPPRYLRPPRPMYYPDKTEDTARYPITDGYPWVKTPTYKIWKKLGRIGLIGILDISESKIDSESIIVEASDYNILTIPTTSPLTNSEKRELRLAQTLLKAPLYSFSSKVVLLIRRIYNRINRMFKS